MPLLVPTMTVVGALYLTDDVLVSTRTSPTDSRPCRFIDPPNSRLFEGAPSWTKLFEYTINPPVRTPPLTSMICSTPGATWPSSVFRSRPLMGSSLMRWLSSVLASVGSVVETSGMVAVTMTSSLMEPGLKTGATSTVLPVSSSNCSCHDFMPAAST